jgi:trk system potassium uptake protein TrkH
VNVLAALGLTGSLLKYLSLAYALPVVVALGYGDPWWPFLAGGAITFAAGLGIERLGAGRGTVGTKEGFLVVTLTWGLAAFFLSLPYMLDEAQLAHPVDAYFEAMSGITTTGASAIRDVTALDHTMALWRSFTQWLGGMGIVVLGLAVLPRLRVGGRQLLESELPGPEYEPLAATIRATARRLWVLYVGLTGLMILILSCFGWAGLDTLMTPYQAAAHAFTTLPTGGFSPQARSAEPFAAASQWVMVAFMVLAGANFALHYRLLRRRINPLRDEELRLYLVLAGVGTLILVLELTRAGIYAWGEEAVRHSAFQAVSIMTTTGYASADYVAWTGLAQIMLVFLMLLGGCAGSTGGAIKIVRHLLIGKLLLRELDIAAHREAIVPIRVNGRRVDERTLRAILGFGLIYVGLFVVGALVIAIEAARAGVEVTAFEAIGASATTIGNVGPAFGFAGPMGSFADFSPFAKSVMTVLMWMGRLEIVPVAILLTRRYWRA